MARRLRQRMHRALLWLAADGRCCLCGCPLPPDWHADHVAPWSVSRETNVFDMQALCPPCNAKKGGRMTLEEKVRRAYHLCDQIAHFTSVMRKPQRETLRFLRDIATGLGGGAWPYLTAPGFLVEEIVPGGGKSFIAVMAASVLVGSGLFDTALWFSPRLTLLEQAKDDFADTSVGRAVHGPPVNVFNPAGLIPQELPDKL